ncbi:MAG TPA: MFS transporter [Micromonosporaceae bacterium]|nr:MFS transporter [Micromonosporaceae bacterium]
MASTQRGSVSTAVPGPQRAAPPRPVPPARALLVLLATCGAQLMIILDDTVVNVALPSIGASLGFGGASLAWVVDAYMLLFGGFLLVGGRGADLLGRRAVFLCGLAVFTLASLVAGLAQSSEVLIVARGAQGFGGALLGPAALSILIVTFTEPDQRRRALGLWGALTGVSGVLGVILGGVVTDSVGWRWVFFINVPIGLVIAVLLLAGAPRGQEAAGGTRGRGLGGLDAALVTGGLVLLVYSVIGTSHRPWGSWQTLGGLAGAAVLLAAFMLSERRAAAPLIPRGVLSRRPIALANVAMILAASGLYALFFFLTQHMQLVHGWSPLRAGVSWIPFGLVFAVCSSLSIQLMPRLGGRVLSVGGLALASAGQLLLVRTTVDGSYAGEMLPALLLSGAGFGFAFVPVVVAGVSGVADAASGIVSGVLATAQQVGGAIGVAALATLATDRFTHHLGSGSSPPAAMVLGYHSAFVVSGLLIGCAAVAALALPSLKTKVDIAAIQGA